METLSEYARDAVKRFPESSIEVAMAFLGQVLPPFLEQSNDRLLKVGRRLVSLVEMAENRTDSHDDILELALKSLVEECGLILSGKIKVPTVEFGKTKLQMPIVTLGCMRFQQEWGPRIQNMNQVGSDCQDNLVEILKTAIRYGIYHIETARGYGSSELQLGVALKQLFQTGFVKRQDLIIQTKISANEDPVAFRENIELSLKNLQLDYIDLFAFHGLNYEEQMEWIFGKSGNNCLSVIQEYMVAGKVRHLGFSTHAPTELVIQCIQKDVFDYVNLHFHYFGSYTASGGGQDGNGNLECIRLLQEKGMGIFIISPFDKGGRLYAPSKKLVSLTLPEMDPMRFQSYWLWNHHLIYNERLPQIHTFTVGCGRPSDLDQPAVAAYLFSIQPDKVLAEVKAVTSRLEKAKQEALGNNWVSTWWKGLPKSLNSKYLVEHNQMVWLYNCIKAFGLYEFAIARYNTFEKNYAKWDESLTPERNISEKVGKNGWGYAPGLPLRTDIDYSGDLKNVPKENFERVLEAETFVYEWCRDTKLDKPNKDNKSQKSSGFLRHNFIVSSKIQEDKTLKEKVIPEEWLTAFDMRPWPDFPDRPSRT